ALSLAGDAAVPAMLWLAWEQPIWFFVALAVAVIAAIVLIVVLMRFLRGLLARLRAGFGGSAPASGGRAAGV
ncbi:MAG: DUF4126 domain-containing protein, partial [Burkholderiales bacterium]